MKFQIRSRALQLRFQLCFRYHESSPLAQNIDDNSVTDPRQLVLRIRIHFMRINIFFCGSVFILCGFASGLEKPRFKKKKPAQWVFLGFLVFFA
jgi:hypothetical protein